MSTTRRPRMIAAPTQGLYTTQNLLAMPEKSALVLDNFIAYADALQQRQGFSRHISGFSPNIQRLWSYSNSSGVESLWGTSNAGIYNCTTPGAAPATSLALTDGRTVGAGISTGANSYLLLVNGVDSLSQYDGATWTAVPTIGGIASTGLSVITSYNQRLFFAKKNTLTLSYLPINSVSGVLTDYELGAIFSKGGFIKAMATWTVDSGAGADDKLVVVTSQGEVAVFQGADPSSASTWTKQGVYLIGKPLGTRCLQKFGGDLLYLCENGLIAISALLLTVSLERISSISDNIRSLIPGYAKNYGALDGWEVIFQPSIPVIIINIPSAPTRIQLCMYTLTGAWSTFSGWNAYSFGRLNGNLYFSSGGNIELVAGTSDNGANIVATCLQAYQQMGSQEAKRIVMLKPFMQPTAGYSVGLGLARDFEVAPTATMVSLSGGASSLWNTAVFNSSYWSATNSVFQDWQSAIDTYSQWKAIFLQTQSSSAVPRYLGTGTRGLYSNGMAF